jgi:hypothetical protein
MERQHLAGTGPAGSRRSVFIFTHGYMCALRLYNDTTAQKVPKKNAPMNSFTGATIN